MLIFWQQLNNFNQNPRCFRNKAFVISLETMSIFVRDRVKSENEMLLRRIPKSFYSTELSLKLLSISVGLNVEGVHQQ